MIVRPRRILMIFSILIFSALAFVSCYGSWNFWYDGNSVDERTKSIRILSDKSDKQFAESGISSLGGKYTVLVLSDTHFGNKKKEVNCKKLYKWLDSKKGSEDYPAFAICLGDATDLGYRDEFDEYKVFCKTLCIDYNLKLVFNSCGNHDIYQNNWDNWERDCYPHTSFYAFQTQKLSWYCLDTASGAVGMNQYKKLLHEFENDSRPKVVFTHYPYVRFNLNCSNMAETTERNLLIAAFYANKVKCLLGGHNHTQTYDNLGYNDYGIPSFAYSEKWGLLFVDEDKEEIYLDFIGD